MTEFPDQLLTRYVLIVEIFSSLSSWNILIVLCSDVAVKSRLSGEAGNDSDGSSDSSEEDLDSPRVIRSAPVSSSSEPVVTGSGGLATSEKMDVDSGIVKLKHYITYCKFSK